MYKLPVTSNHNMEYIDMKKLFLALCFSALLLSCAQDPEYSEQVNQNFVVEELFTYKGITMYRFSDAGHYRYFTNHGVTHFDDAVHNGKSTTYYPQTIE
jgi:hypothetical protein